VEKIYKKVINVKNVTWIKM